MSDTGTFHSKDARGIDGDHIIDYEVKSRSKRPSRADLALVKADLERIKGEVSAALRRIDDLLR